MVARLLEVRRRLPVAFFFLSYLKRRISENICFQIYFSSINFDFLGQMFLVRKRWVHETASSTRINNPSSTKLSYSKWKNAVLNPSKSFLALKKVNSRILSTFKRPFSKKWEKTLSLHIIHSLEGEYCWIVRDSEPIRLLNNQNHWVCILNIVNEQSSFSCGLQPEWDKQVDCT